MKKLLVCIFLLMCILYTTAWAKPGDVAGVYYSTDINTYLNGCEIDSINIGGETLISAEDMQFYSFSVTWSNAERSLKVYSVAYAANGLPPHIKKSNYPSGMVLGEYYETDIVTYLDGDPITAYNIGGRTYMHAEEMRNFGYEVIWDSVDRNLFVTSPDRAGYVYNINLSKGKAQEKEGIGGFSLKYTPDGIFGSGDAEYATATFQSLPREHTVILEFYQNEGLFQSGKLRDLLTSLSSGNNAVPVYDQRLKYDIVNQYIKFSVNGYTAKCVYVANYRGNGHVDIYITATDLPKFKKEEIKEIIISVGEQNDSEGFEIIIPETELDKLETVIDEKLKKYPNDYVQTYHQTDEYFAVYIRESKHLGVFNAHRLYLVNRNTWECSEDILEQVRLLDGFDYEILNPFDFKVGAVKNNFFFACKSKEKTGNFYVEMDTAKVHQISERLN